MKPSERIKEIRGELKSDGRPNFPYEVKAIIQYLDEEFEKNKYKDYFCECDNCK